MIVGLVLAAAVGLVSAALTRPLLQWLPEPVGAGDKVPYRHLATVGLAIGCGLLSGGSAAIASLALPGPVQPLWWVLSSVGVLLAVIDAKTTWLPLRLTRLGWLLMAAATLGSLAWGGDWSLLLRAAIGAAAAGLLYLLVWVGSRGGFGFGDVRFAPLLGAAAAAQSWTMLIWALLLGTLVGGVHGLVRLVRRRREAFPYAPSMLAGAYLACLGLAFGLIPT